MARRMVRKTTRRPRRSYRRKTTVPKAMVRSNTCFFKKRFVWGSFGATAAVGWQNLPMQFNFDQLPDASVIRDMFDSYRILGIKCLFTPYWDSLDAQQGAGPTYFVLPRVYTGIDYNGIPVGGLLTESLALERSNARQVRKPAEPFSIYIKNPTCEAIGQTALGSASGLMKSRQWIDTQNGNIAHHGAWIGMVVPTTASAAAGWYYHITVTYYLQVKHAQ